MFGFLIEMGKRTIDNTLDDPLAISYEDFRILYSPLRLFEDDKLFFEDNDNVYLLDGFILNKQELIADYRGNDWKETFLLMFKEQPAAFMVRFRGGFCGCIYSKNRKELLLFTNQLGEKAVYYTHNKDGFYASSHNDILLSSLRSIKQAVLPDIKACRELLATGSCLHGKTPFDKISRLTGGYRLLYREGAVREERYHIFKNTPEWTLSLEETVEQFDDKFRTAVDRLLRKSKEYGYNIECDISGGLDSRMVNWVAHDLGYDSVINYCYSQPRSIDHEVSKKISADLGNEYNFISLEEGRYLLDIDERMRLFGGQVSFVVSSGSLDVARQIKDRNIGMCVTGILGEIYKADWTEAGNKHTPPNYISNRYSNIVDYDFGEDFISQYDNYEQLNLYEYGALKMLSSAFIRQQVCEAASPFIDVDFVEFAFRIPLKYRKQFLLASTWIMKKYPQSGKYNWQTKRMPVDKFYYKKIYFPKVISDIKMLGVRGINKACRILDIHYQIPKSDDMIPFDVWYRKNDNFRNFFDNYYSNGINLISDLGLRKDVEDTFKKGNARDKLQAVDIVALYKNYYQNNESSAWHK